MAEQTLDRDILQPIPFEEWPLLQSKIKCDWPAFAYYYYWLENAIKWKKTNSDLPIELYCPNGDYQEGTFIGISQFSMYIVIAFTLDPSKETLKKVLLETRYLDWTQGIYFAGCHNTIAPTVLSVVEYYKKIYNFETYPITPGYYHFKPAEDCRRTRICVPQECYLKKLSASDVPLIHSKWPHADPEYPELSIKYLTVMIEMNEGLGLYLKKDDSLVSWAIHTDWHGMGMVQTLEEHKRKGYGRTVVNALAKNLGEKGISTTLFIVEGNTVSEKFFLSMGWKFVSQIAWIVLKKPCHCVPKN